MSALHWAAQWGNLPVVKMLVRQGADLNLPQDGSHTSPMWTPLHKAVNPGRLEVVEFLI